MVSKRVEYDIVTEQQKPEHYEETKIQWKYGTDAMQTQEPWLEPTYFFELIKLSLYFLPHTPWIFSNRGENDVKQSEQ